MEKKINYSNQAQKAALGDHWFVSAEEFLRAEAASHLADGKIPEGLRGFADLLEDQRLSAALDAAVFCYTGLAEELGQPDIWEFLRISEDRRAQFLRAVVVYPWLHKGLCRALDNHCPIGGMA